MAQIVASHKCHATMKVNTSHFAAERKNFCIFFSRDCLYSCLASLFYLSNFHSLCLESIFQFVIAILKKESELASDGVLSKLPLLETGMAVRFGVATKKKKKGKETASKQASKQERGRRNGESESSNHVQNDSIFYIYTVSCVF